MATVEQPITRTELREELDRVLVHYATKKDLADLKADLIKWMAATQFLGLTVTAGIVTAVATVLRLWQ